MSGEKKRRVIVRVRTMTAPSSLDTRTASERIQQAISDRRFGPAADPVIRGIAEQIAQAIDTKHGGNK